MNANQYLDTPIDAISTFDNIEVAPTWKRFINFFIDTTIYYLNVIVLLSAIMVYNTEMVVDENNGEYTFIYYILFFSVILVYYTIFEGLLGGKTIGKMITGSRVIYYSGESISIKTAFIRSLCRLVPFEPFSCFGGSAWHDQWTDTMVVNESDYRKAKGF